MTHPGNARPVTDDQEDASAPEGVGQGWQKIPFLKIPFLIQIFSKSMDSIPFETQIFK